MTQEQIQEGNKLIARFMGDYDLFQWGEDPFNGRMNATYHEDWNWLIPAVEKICNTTFKSEIGAKFYPIVDIEIGHTSFSRSTMWSMGEKRIFVSRCTGEAMIDHCWYAVIDAINFYNKYSDK